MEKLTIKEKAGIKDSDRIFEGLHLSESFLRRIAIDSDSVTNPEFKKRAESHFSYCDECLKKREAFLPLGDTDK